MNPGQWIVWAAAAGVVGLILVLATCPLKDRPEVERFKPRPGDDHQFARWLPESDQDEEGHRRAA